MSTGQRFSPKQVGDALNETDPKVVGMAFARMVRFSKAIKGGDGLYAAPHQPPEHLKREAS